MLHRRQGEPGDHAAVAAAELYDRDPVLWAEQQAGLLAMVAAGQRPAGVDWTNLIEEIESLGRSQVTAVQSLLLQALVHEFKAVCWPDAPYVEHWLNESRLFQVQARQQYLPSMRQRIDAAKLLTSALDARPSTIDGAKPVVDISGYGASILSQVDRWLADPTIPISLTDRPR